MGPIRTRNVDATLDSLFVQYGERFRVVSSRKIDGDWIEILVESSLAIAPLKEHNAINTSTIDNPQVGN